MATVMDYLQWRGDLSFDVAPINELDLFLFTQLSMPDYQDILDTSNNELPLCKVADRYFKTHTEDVRNLGLLQAKDVLPAFKLMGKCSRFQDVGMSTYYNHVSEENEEQFSATTFRLSPKVLVVSYRGTDDTIIGWKEDCNLAIYDQVPAQQDAKEYLEKIAKTHKGNIVVVGHSKGGNLSVYAASHVDNKIQDRIIRVVNYDGPGFGRSFLRNNEGYRNIKDKVTTIMSMNAIIGTLLEAPGKKVTVKTFAEGLAAHDGFAWEVDVNHFVREKGLSRFSKAFDGAFNQVMKDMSTEDKKIFVEDIFSSLFSTGALNLTEFNDLDIKQKFSAFEKLGASKAIRDFNTSFFKQLVKNTEKTIKNIQ